MSSREKLDRPKVRTEGFEMRRSEGGERLRERHDDEAEKLSAKLVAHQDSSGT